MTDRAEETVELGEAIATEVLSMTGGDLVKATVSLGIAQAKLIVRATGTREEALLALALEVQSEQARKYLTRLIEAERASSVE